MDIGEIERIEVRELPGITPRHQPVPEPLAPQRRHAPERERERIPEKV